MEFHEKLYTLRKQKGLSQEELAYRLNVSRQTISKWEMGDSTPDMEKLMAISRFFGVSLDELVMDKSPQQSVTGGIVEKCKREIWTEKNKEKVKRGLKIAAVIFGIILCIDVVSMIVYFCLNGFPQ